MDNSNHILAWKYKELSDESIKPPAASNNTLAPELTLCIRMKPFVDFFGRSE